MLLLSSIADENPTISVALMENANHEEHHEEDYESPAYCSKSSVQSDEEASCYILSPRVRLKTDENACLLQLLPVAAADVGVPFVTHLTGTNLKRHDMVYICVSLCKVKFKINFISSSMTWATSMELLLPTLQLILPQHRMCSSSSSLICCYSFYL